jgi:hypothetical protein
VITTTHPPRPTQIASPSRSQAHTCNRRVVVTISEFTEEAEITGEEVTNLRLIEGEELLEMFTESGI